MRLYTPRWAETCSFVEITCRTPMGQFLLAPRRKLTEVAAGVLGYPFMEDASPCWRERPVNVRLCAVQMLSNHMHLLAVVEDTDHMARYMQFVNGNMSKEVRHLVGDDVWPGHLWARRYTHVPITREPAAQIERLKYVLSQGLEEGLIDRPSQWPGLHSVDALTQGLPIVGRWYNRKKRWAAWQRGEELSPEEYSQAVKIDLAPIPCMAHLSPDEYQRWVADLVQEIEAEAEERRLAEGRARKTEKMIWDLTKVRRTRRPDTFKRSPAPVVHAATKRVREEFRQAYSEIVRAYRDAADRLRAGDREVAFPEGTFPPGLPFVPAVARPPP